MSGEADDQRLSHRVGAIAAISSISDKKSPGGRLWRYTHAEIVWDGESEPSRVDLTGEHQAGDRVAVVYRGSSQICDVNLRTGAQSVIGDRLEGVAALIMLIAMPLNFILIGLPIYYGVRLWSRVSTRALRKRVAAYIEANIRPLVQR